ncbi:MAG: MFS transporter [Chloroflexota bacterium]
MDFSNPEQRRKMILLGGLYISQYLGISFIFAAVPAILRSTGASLQQLSYLFLLSAIWALKFLWAPLIDRYGSEKYGHYRGWLIVLQSLLIIFMIIASFFDIETQFWLLFGLFLIISVLSATQDIAADALGVTILSPEERGIGNSIQGAGTALGGLIGGGLALMTFEWLGWTASMLVLAAGTAIPLINILMYEEKPAPSDQREEKVGLRDVVGYFRRPGIGRWLVVLLTYSLGIGMMYNLINPMLVDIGWSLDQIGFTLNVVGILFTMAGAGLAGWLVQKLGRKNTMLGGNAFVGVAILLLLPLASGSSNQFFIYLAVAMMLFAFGANVTILSTMMMDKSDPASAGTDFTVQYCIGTVFAIIAGGAALAVAETIQYTGVLWISVGAVLLSLFIVWRYNDFAPINYDDPVGSDQLSVAGD